MFFLLHLFNKARKCVLDFYSALILLLIYKLILLCLCWFSKLVLLDAKSDSVIIPNDFRRRFNSSLLLQFDFLYLVDMNSFK